MALVEAELSGEQRSCCARQEFLCKLSKMSQFVIY